MSLDMGMESAIGASGPCVTGTGPECPCHQHRNMERMGERLYRCQISGQTYEFQVAARDPKGYRMVEL